MALENKKEGGEAGGLGDLSDITWPMWDKDDREPVGQPKTTVPHWTADDRAVDLGDYTDADGGDDLPEEPAVAPTASKRKSLHPHPYTDEEFGILPPKPATYPDSADAYEPTPIHVAPARTIGAATASRSRLTTSFQPGMAFELTSSIVATTPEVSEMRRAHESGRPLAIYEILQGMVDYGSGKTPPPRMRVCYSDGSRADFDGTDAAFKRTDIVAIEFFNAGQGLKPEELTIIRHNQERDDTLGRHGRGTTVALTYLNCEGINTSVTSNCYGYQWQAKTHLEPTTTGLDKALAVSGTVTEQVSATDEHTLFRVEAGDDPARFKKLCAEALQATELFLYANPNFPGASLVEPKVDSEAMRANMLKSGALCKVSTGEVMCLVGIADSENDAKGHSFIYVDGVKLPLGYYGRQTLLPWSISGLGNAPYPYTTCRGTDSSSLRADNLRQVIFEAVRNLKDKEILRRLIKTCVATGKNYEEFSTHNTRSINPATAELVREIWLEEYGTALVNDESSREARYVQKFGKSPSFKGVKTVNRHLYHFLVTCKITSLVKEVAEQDCTRIQSYERFKVPFLNSTNVLQELITFIIKQSAGEVNIGNELIELDGQQYLSLGFANEQNGDLRNDYSATSRCVKVAGVVSTQRGCGMRILLTEKDKISELDVTITERSNDGSFTAGIEVVSYDEEQRAKYGNLKDGHTYILIPDNATPQEEDQSSGPLAYAKRIWRELQAKLQQSKDLADLLGRRHNAFERARLAREIAGQRIGKVRRTGVVKVGSRGNSLNSAALSSQLGGLLMSLGQGNPDQDANNQDDFLLDRDAVMVPGFYANSVANRFGYDTGASTIYCEGESDLVPIEVPRKAKTNAPADGCKHTITNLKGERLLPVKSGHRLTAYALPQGGDVQFYRDVRTGMYSIVGEAPSLSYSTAPDHAGEKLFYQIQPPLAEEREDVVAERHYLDARWQDFLGAFPKRALTKVETERRVAAASQRWGQDYTYDAATELNEQVHGGTLQEVMSKVLNTRRGICNLSASGFAALLRAMNVPTRIVAGYAVMQWGGGGTHATVEYWNTEEWVQIDPGDFIGNAGNARFNWYGGEVKKPQQTPPVKRPVSPRSRLRMAVMAVLAATTINGDMGKAAWPQPVTNENHVTTPAPGVTPPEGPKPPKDRSGDAGTIKSFDPDSIVAK